MMTLSNETRAIAVEVSANGAYVCRAALAEALADCCTSEVLAMAWRFAMERESMTQDQFNRGHLKP